MQRILSLAVAGLAVGMALATAAADAQTAWPQPGRTVRVIVPWPPGAANDALGRLIAQRLQDKFGATTVVENRSGGSGFIGTNSVIRAEPDGYTLLASAFNTAVMPLVVKGANFDPETDLEFIGRTAVSPMVLIISTTRPQKSVPELVAAAKANPRDFLFAISSPGSAGHLATIAFSRRSGVAFDMIPYRGTTPALTDVMGGSVQLMIDPAFALLPTAREGTRVRALAITARERTKLASELPTMAEAGLAGLEFNSWYGIWAPKGTPRDIQEKVNALIQETMRDPEVIAKLNATLLEPVAESIADSRKFMASEVVRSRELLQSVGFKPE